jgi:5-methyltetrahydrofolate--homocysteine methyltransferase
MDLLRRQQLDDALATRILILDGAMGTMLQAYHPTAADYGGPGLEGCNEHLCHTHPEWIGAVHRAYLEAGADLISTNSFQGSPIVLAEFGLEQRTRELNVTAARLARQAADEFATTMKPRFVAGALGPTTKSMTLRGDVTFQQLRETYYLQARALVEGGVDLLLFETVFDTRSVKAGLLAVQQLEGDLGVRIPVMVSATIEPWGTMLAGQAMDAFYASIGHADLLSVGLNCSTGPDAMEDHIRTLANLATTRISCHPNAGLPDEDGEYLETPELLARQLDRFAQAGRLNIVGGCCGTTPAHIRAIAQMADGRTPHAVNPPTRRVLYSGIDLVEADPRTRPLLVGERTNVMGSRRFKQLIADEKWEEASEIARAQVRHGARMVDVCLQSTERDEAGDVDPFYAALMPRIRVPVMIDTTDSKGVERALTWCQGKSVINSITLEDGEGQFERVCPIARAFGAAIVVGTIDEDARQAQAFTRERKLAVAERSVRVAAKHGIAPEDVIVDPLVFPCGTGDESYIGGAVETIEAIRLIKARIPFVSTMISVSAVSFGLPDAARDVVNSVLLYHATGAGVDLAMVNTERLEPFAAIAPDERRLAENLLFNRPALDAGDERLRAAPEDWRQQTAEQKTGLHQLHVAAIVDHFRRTVRLRPGRRRRAADRGEQTPGADAEGGCSSVCSTRDQRLSACIVEGVRDGLLADLDLKLKEGASALEIINGPLMAGMTEVGRMFGRNELIVAEVLRSAEVMNAAVRHLRPFIPSGGLATRGTIVLGTVKGDVHDIGKNLVEIILANNGYSVVNLGIRVPSADLIRAVREHRPDAIGLSGLLVKSAHQMVTVGTELRAQGVDVPLLVGGAALSEKFVRTRIGPAYGAPTFYAADAMAGLRIMNELLDPVTREAAIRTHRFRPEVRLKADTTYEGRSLRATSARSPKVRTDVPIPAAPCLERRVREIGDLRDVWRYMNPSVLFGRHLGFRGRFEQRLAERDPTALELCERVEAAKEDAATFMKVRAVWQFFEAVREGNAVQLFEPGATVPLETFQFGRQPANDGLCLSDYVLDARKGRRDHVGLLVVTAGEGVRERAEAAKQRGEFVHSHILQALALETAEGAAEWVHRRMREEWGFPDLETMTMGERSAARYRGKRYSFGYPACPNLDDQQGIWRLLSPDEIGVQLTDGFMMDPEASVSALVFHHPDCIYFATGEAEPAQD